eukprot:873007-Rhodomonas_salina.1
MHTSREDARKQRGILFRLRWIQGVRAHILSGLELDSDNATKERGDDGAFQALWEVFHFNPR